HPPVCANTGMLRIIFLTAQPPLLCKEGNRSNQQQVTKLSILFPLLLLFALSPPQRPGGPGEAIRLNNLGVGYMNQARVGEALQMFRRAAAADPSLFAARLNEGIALLNNQ